jgi:hypothetical protein
MGPPHAAGDLDEPAVAVIPAETDCQLNSSNPKKTIPICNTPLSHTPMNNHTRYRYGMSRRATVVALQSVSVFTLQSSCYNRRI